MEKDKDGIEATCKMSGIQIVVPPEIRKRYNLQDKDGDTYLKVRFIGEVDVKTTRKEKMVQDFRSEDLDGDENEVE